MKVILGNGEQLEATSGHPFYVQGKGWNVAATLKVGDALRLHNGVTLVVKTVETSTRVGRVYNFTVAQNANYFVGEDGVLVHNSCKPWKTDAYHGPKSKYENYGHHDPSSPLFRGGGSKTTSLPGDAEEVYGKAIFESNGKNWWGKSSTGEYYRYSSSNNGKAHWNGRQNSSRGLKIPRYI